MHTHELRERLVVLIVSRVAAIRAFVVFRKSVLLALLDTSARRLTIELLLVPACGACPANILLGSRWVIIVLFLALCRAAAARVKILFIARTFIQTLTAKSLRCPDIAWSLAYLLLIEVEYVISARSAEFYALHGLTVYFYKLVRAVLGALAEPSPLTGLHKLPVLIG